MSVDRTVSSGAAVTLRPMTDADHAAVAAVSLAQDLAWWGEPHGDADDVRVDIDRAVLAMGTLADGTRLAVSGNEVVGVALHVGHGQTSLFADPAHPAAREAMALLLEWLLSTGAEEIDVPAHDGVLLAVAASLGLVSSRSSFELERDPDLSDLARTSLASGVELVEFRPGIDDREVYDTIYSVWTDVPGHTQRTIEEWRELFIGGPRFDPGLVVVARRRGGDQRVAGAAIGSVFDDVGWVMQLAVGRPDRSLGLGRSLLVEALHRLAGRDVRRVGLSVEAANATALGLYRSVGLEIIGEWQHLTLPPTPPPPR